MESKRRNMFYHNKKQETKEIVYDGGISCCSDGMVMAVMGLREAWRWLVTLGLVWSLAASGGRATTSPYTSQWAAHIQGGPTVASQVADRNGFTLLAENMFRRLDAVFSLERLRVMTVHLD
ncbi:hypothetical protein AAG570_006567 [Ranatra chinensis]|uniref:Uncharacterized protein n=1 Tax=Ranatra chinensis TaxID=642074 RepID=A0ABD0YUQ4_9HEMI